MAQRHTMTTLNSMDRVRVIESKMRSTLETKDRIRIDALSSLEREVRLLPSVSLNNQRSVSSPKKMKTHSEIVQIERASALS